MKGMKPLALALPLLLATPAVAQDQPSGLDLIGEGAGQILQGLASEAAPAIAGLQGVGAEALGTIRTIVAEMGPGFFDVFNRVDAISNYDAPVILPNGDILIARSPGAPDWTPPAE